MTYILPLLISEKKITSTKLCIKLIKREKKKDGNTLFQDFCLSDDTAERKALWASMFVDMSNKSLYSTNV